MFKTLVRSTTFSHIRRFSLTPQVQNTYNKNFFNEENEQLNTYYPNVVKQMCNWDFIEDFPGLSERYRRLLDYAVNVGDTKRMSTCLLTLYAYKRFEKAENLTAENFQKAYVMSWAYRLIETAQVIIDDVIDKSDIRYNKPTWHKTEGIENAILDFYFLENGAYLLLDNELKNHSHYSKIVQLFKYSMFKFSVGQVIDGMVVDINKSAQLFPQRLTKGTYTADTPVRSAMFLSNMVDEDHHSKVKEIMEPAGAFSVIQNDYWGIYAPYAQFKKSCNDIAQGKNNWFYGKAFELSNEAQKEILKEHYGKSNENSIKMVQDLYNELKMDKAYEQNMENYFKNLHEKVENLPVELPKDVFHDILNIVPQGYING